MSGSKGLLVSFKLLWTLGVVWGLCDLGELKQGIGECEAAGSRTAVYYWANCSHAPPPAFSFPCDIECSAGSYLSTDAAKRIAMCKVCPANWYSEGGARVWEEQWKGVWRYFEQKCEGGNSEKCPNWRISEDQLHLETALTGSSGVSYKSTLFGRFSLVKPGLFRLNYRHFSSLSPSASFTVLINSFPIHIDTSLSTSWHSLHTPLLAGINQIDIIYQFTSIPHIPSQAQVRFISIPGISYADFECKQCRKGLISAKGASGCQYCPANSVFNRTIAGCSPCNADYYALPGAQYCDFRPICGPKDYIIHESPCIEGEKSIQYEWKKPLICAWKQYKLPADQLNLPCDDKPCPAGYEKQDNYCQICSKGLYSRAGERCQTCPAGFIPLQQTNYSDWQELPIGFESYCDYITGRKCAYSQGWVLSGDRLESGQLFEAPIRQILSFTANFTEFPAGIDFLFSLSLLHSSQAYLFFSLNNAGERKYTASNPSTVHIDIEELGEIRLSWGFVSYEPSDSASLQWITVTGTQFSPSSSCIQCPKGYISHKGAAQCDICPAGTAADVYHCAVCPKDLVSWKAGEECELCPFGTISKGNYCELSEIMLFANEEIAVNIGKLEKGIMGPIKGRMGDYYLSLFEPIPQSKLEAIIGKEGLETAFIYGTREIPMENHSNFSQKISFGSRVSAIDYDNELTISLIKGGKCAANGLLSYSSLIRLICDPSKEQTWPTVAHESPCYVELQWTIRQACPICNPSNTRNHTNPCAKGMKWTKVEDSEGCVWPGPRFVSESCSEIVEIMLSVEAGISTGIGAGLAGILFLTWSLKMKEKRRIEMLIKREKEDFLQN